MTRKCSFVAVAAMLCGATFPLSAALAGAPQRGGDTGSLTIENRRSEGVQVKVDGELVGLLPAKGTASYAVAPGGHKVALLDEEGDLIQARRLEVHKRTGAQMTLRSGVGTVVLRNRSGVEQVVMVTDRDGLVRHQTLADGASMDLRVNPGEVALKTARTVQGMELPLEEHSLVVAPKARRKVALDPVETSVMRVENRSDGAVTFFQGEDVLGMVPGGAVGQLVVPVGQVTLHGVYDGMAAFSRRVMVDGEDGASIVVDVQVGQVVAINESRAAARVVVDGKNFGWMRPGDSRRLELPAGAHTVSFVSGGEVVNERAVTISAAQRHRLVLRPFL